MLRASRILLSSAKSAVRPTLNGNGNARPSTGPPPRGPRVTPLGIAFILGGLALGSYMLKPTTRMPAAAMDTFKPQVAIVFAKGDSNGAARRAAKNLGFEYLNMREGLDSLGALVESGHTRFIIDGFLTPQEISNVDKNVVAPDLVLDYDKNAQEALRVVPMSQKSSVEEVIRDRNLA